jgi:hypothetical protein
MIKFKYMLIISTIVSIGKTKKINKNIPEKKENILNIYFKDKDLQEDFKKEKDFYKNLFSKFFIFFKNGTNSFYKQKSQLIKMSYDIYPKKLQDKIFLQIILSLSNLDVKKKKIIIDWDKNSIKEIEYNNLDKLFEINIEILTNKFSLLELLNNRKITEEEMEYFNKVIYKYEIEEKNKITEINRVIEFKDLIINKEKLSNQNQITQLQKNPDFNNLFNFFINENNSTENEKNMINNYIWIFIEFLNDIYKDYFSYLNNQETNFPIEVEILKKLINFKEKNNFLQDISCMELYNFVKFLFQAKIEKIDNKFYIFNTINTHTYTTHEILNLANYNNLQIFYNSLLFIVNLLRKKDHLTIEGYNTFIYSIQEIYVVLINQLFQKPETFNI